MRVIAYGPFRVGSVLWQPRTGAWAFTVICKATFELAPRESPLILPPKNALESEPGAGIELRRSLYLATDHVPLKRAPEVIVVGHAYAPAGAVVTSLVVRLAVGDVDKAVQVFGDRYRTMEGALVGPSRFTKMPLVWERAAGGPGTSNPAGVRMGADAVADGWGRVVLPNLQAAVQSIITSEDVVEPVGFGPIAPTWPSRMARLHRHAAIWDAARWNQQPLPDDVDFAYFNAAPPDQALKELTGHERIVLENLHPRFARLATYLPVVTPRATASWEGGPSKDVLLRCDTLLIDTDHGTATLIWRGNVPLDHPERAGIVLVSDQQNCQQSAVETVFPGAVLGPVMPFREAGAEMPPVGWKHAVSRELRHADVRKGAMEWGASVDDGTGTMMAPLVREPSRPVLPFAEQAPSAMEPSEIALDVDLDEATTGLVALSFAAPSMEPLSPRAPPAGPPPAEWNDVAPRLPPPILDSSLVPSAPALTLTFVEAEQRAALPRSNQAGANDGATDRLVLPKAPLSLESDGTETLSGGMITVSPVSKILPFVAVPPGATPALVATTPASHRVSDGTETLLAGMMTASPVLPFMAQEAPFPPFALPQQHHEYSPRRSQDHEHHDDSQSSSALLAQPIAPLKAVAASTEPPVQPVRAAPARPRPEIPLEQYARVKVEVWDGGLLDAALAEHGIDEVDWLIHERHLRSAIASEAQEGRTDLALALTTALAKARTALFASL